MVDGAQPTALAIERADQCVALGGAVSSVSRTVSAIASSPILRGVPGPGSMRDGSLAGLSPLPLPRRQALLVEVPVCR